MKKLILIALMLLAAVPAAPARAETGPLILLIAGNNANNAFSVSLNPDGRSYSILSTLALEVGGSICSHPEQVPTELSCKATAIAGFEVNTAGGSDTVLFSSDIPVPVTVRGGSGNDRLSGGSTADKIIGGAGDDRLSGRRGDDWIEGGPGADRLMGGQGDDQLRGGPDEDKLIGGPGENTLLP
jgi:Ca2+-binding RTX toxin-like protein